MSKRRNSRYSHITLSAFTLSKDFKTSKILDWMSFFESAPLAYNLDCCDLNRLADLAALLITLNWLLNMTLLMTVIGREGRLLLYFQLKASKNG